MVFKVLGRDRAECPHANMQREVDPGNSAHRQSGENLVRKVKPGGWSRDRTRPFSVDGLVDGLSPDDSRPRRM